MNINEKPKIQERAQQNFWKDQAHERGEQQITTEIKIMRESEREKERSWTQDIVATNCHSHEKGQ